ncbi:MAG: ion channel DMI1 [Rhodothermales bacterium]
MPRRLANRFKFRLERFILRGALFRLLVIALVMGAIALVAGLLVYLFTGGFAQPGEAIWWAFLRMTDSGYLGDDEGAFLRTVSTFLTVAGIVLFLGALIAILTQWLNQTIEELEGGHTPVALRNHIVILGWTNRTAAVVRELILSEGRMRRFLRRHGTRGLRIAILAEEEPAPLLLELRERLGALWNERQVILRSGTPLRLDHLRRVDFLNAATILLPAADFSDKDASADTQVIKTLLSMTNHPAVRTGAGTARPLPPVVAEIFDAQKIPIARGAYGGRVELLASDSIISRLIAQNVRHRGLSHVYGELLSHGRGNELYIREHPAFDGLPLHALHGAFPTAVLLGIVRQHGESFSPFLNPRSDFTAAPGDRFVLLARDYDDAAPDPRFTPAAIATGESAPRTGRPVEERQILLLGWSHRVPALLQEFDSYHEEAFQIDILSLVPAAERERYMERYDVRPSRIALTHIEGDYNAPADLRRANPDAYTNVVLIGSDWLESGAESDARTILGHLLLRDLLPDDGPEILLELLDPENLSLFRRRPSEVLISPMILSHMLAQVALRPELRAVFDELFGPGGAEIAFVPAPRYGLGTEPVTFPAIQQRATQRGEIALGVRLAPRDGETGSTVRLNPPKKTEWALGPSDDLVVLTTYA